MPFQPANFAGINYFRGDPNLYDGLGRGIEQVGQAFGDRRKQEREDIKLEEEQKRKQTEFEQKLAIESDQKRIDTLANLIDKKDKSMTIEGKESIQKLIDRIENAGKVKNAELTPLNDNAQNLMNNLGQGAIAPNAPTQGAIAPTQLTRVGFNDSLGFMSKASITAESKRIKLAKLKEENPQAYLDYFGDIDPKDVIKDSQTPEQIQREKYDLARNQQYFKDSSDTVKNVKDIYKDSSLTDVSAGLDLIKANKIAPDGIFDVLLTKAGKFFNTIFGERYSNEALAGDIIQRGGLKEGVEGLSKFGGSDTERELAVSLQIAPSEWDRKDVRARLYNIKLKADTSGYIKSRILSGPSFSDTKIEAISQFETMKNTVLGKMDASSTADLFVNELNRVLDEKDENGKLKNVGASFEQNLFKVYDNIAFDNLNDKQFAQFKKELHKSVSLYYKSLKKEK